MANMENNNEVGVQQVTPSPFPTPSNVGAALNDLLLSIANEENALANLIDAEANKILRARTALTPNAADLANLNDVVESAERLLRTIVKKNIVLETKTEEVLDSAAALAGRPDLGVVIGSLLTGLVAVLGSIANEEFRLGDLIDELAGVINRASQVAVNTDQLIAANDVVNSTLRSIIKKEIVLETKMQDVLEFIERFT
ncbi:MAG TPA: hypothetical protein VEY68_05565 [Anoxybacillus sp.]|jgi:hypothetical protein|nr:hypothetical protein [Anoxybacillus sp.]